MGELQVVNDGALLVQDGVVRETGTARRIENLAEARKAQEIDAGGRVVMPAYVDPDTMLVTAGVETPRNGAAAENAIAITSKTRLETQARLTMENLVRHGVLAIGASTHGARDLRDARKLLNVQKGFQSRPLRIRSVFAPRRAEWAGTFGEEVDSWATAIVGKRLAGLLELELPLEDAERETFAALEQLGRIAVADGFILRLRSGALLSDNALKLIQDTGAISVIAPGLGQTAPTESMRASSVLVLTASDALGGVCGEGEGRRLLDDGWAVALGTGYTGAGPGCFNPQHALHVACSRLGMSIEEAITAATWNAASSLRMSAVAGSIEPGRQADLAIVDLRDYRELAERPGHNDIYMVLRAGRPIFRRSGLLPF